MKYNKLQFGIYITTTDVSKLKLCISTSLKFYSKTYRNEIDPGATPFFKEKGFRIFS